MARQPTVSVIITSYTTERLRDVYELLDSIRTQTYPNIETIFVAERSEDLYRRVEDYSRERFPPARPSQAAEPVGLKLLFNDGEPGLSAARNLGIKHAKGELIAFVDDDALLYPDWAEQVVRSLEDHSIAGVTGCALPLWEDESMAWLPEEFYWIISCTGWSNWDETREIRNAWGMNMCFKREAFDLAGPFLNNFGFHKGPMAEDNEFSLRVRARTGKRILYCPNIWLWHKVHRYRLSQRFVRERAYWIGHSRRMLKKLYPEVDTGTGLLNQEHQLLKRILTRVPFDILKTFFRNPTIAWHKLTVVTVALFFVTLGYYSHLLPNLWLTTKAEARSDSA